MFSLTEHDPKMCFCYSVYSVYGAFVKIEVLSQICHEGKLASFRINRTWFIHSNICHAIHQLQSNIT